MVNRLFTRQIWSAGTRTQPSISTRALRLMTALVTVHSPFTCFASAPTRSVPDGWPNRTALRSPPPAARLTSVPGTAAAVAILATLETLAWAQAPAPAPPPADSSGVAMALIAIAVFLALVVVLVKWFDRKRRRDEDDMALEARISDALLTDPALSGLPVTAHVKRAGLGPGAPTAVVVTGTVPDARAGEACFVDEIGMAVRRGGDESVCGPGSAGAIDDAG